MLCRLSQKEQTSVRILKEQKEGWEDEDKKGKGKKKNGTKIKSPADWCSAVFEDQWKPCGGKHRGQWVYTCVCVCVRAILLGHVAFLAGLSGLCVQEWFFRCPLLSSLSERRILSHWVAEGNQLWTENNMLDLAWKWRGGWRRGECHDALSRLPVGWGTQQRPALCLSSVTYFLPSKSTWSPVHVSVCLAGGARGCFCTRRGFYCGIQK